MAIPTQVGGEMEKAPNNPELNLVALFPATPDTWHSLPTASLQLSSRARLQIVPKTSNFQPPSVLRSFLGVVWLQSAASTSYLSFLSPAVLTVNATPLEPGLHFA
uniref:Uncharacterized protein n=1 Tax=Sphaerodactylus townsendi TaxID=933632 RepID=A0ACB8ESE9_9SAUR